jgi:hypothetical protein
MASIRDVAESRHEAQCTKSHAWGHWSRKCVAIVDAMVLQIIRDESWWKRS